MYQLLYFKNIDFKCFSVSCHLLIFILKGIERINLLSKIIEDITLFPFFFFNEKT